MTPEENRRRINRIRAREKGGERSMVGKFHESQYSPEQKEQAKKNRRLMDGAKA